jgi:hypothetical protein
MKRALPLFAVLTVVATWPQAANMSTLASQHQDVYFNMWRLRWFAHALVTPSASLFDANIFYPEPRTLALSDAMFVEGLLAAPLTWLGLNPLMVHNLTLLAALAFCGVAMFALAHYLTGSAGAGIVAGIIFAYAPYRFEHYMHMELQWAMWAPLTFLALHRLCDTGRMRYGIAFGACIALQMLSSIYYGIFLATLAGLGVLLFVPKDRAVPLRALVKPMAAAGLIAAVACALYAQPYLKTRQRMGDRPENEVVTFSARAGNYLSATESNWLYGATATRGRGERHLFPGLTPVVLALVALLTPPLGRRPIIYLLLLTAAFEMSLGPNGFIYPVLHGYVPLYRGLRAAARLALFVLLFLSVLAAYGYRALALGRSPAFRYGLLAICSIALLVEYRVNLNLVPFTNTAPEIYRLLASQPKGVVAEFPVPRSESLPGPDAGYAYLSTFHWFPIVNGYSGIYPPSYLARLDRLVSFPDERALEQLRSDRVRYVIVHQFGYDPETLNELRTEMERMGVFVELGSFPDGDGQAWLYRMR